MLECFVIFSGFFYEVTLCFSGSLFVTSNPYFCELVGIQNKLHRLCGIDGDPLLKRNGTIYEGKV